MYYASWWACWEFVAHRVHVEWLTGTTGSWEAGVGQDTDAGVLPWREERAGGVSVCGRRLGPQRGYRLRHSTGGVCATTSPATKVCTLTRYSTLFTDSYCERVSSSVLSWKFYAFEGGFFNDPLYSDLDGWVADGGGCLPHTLGVAGSNPGRDENICLDETFYEVTFGRCDTFTDDPLREQLLA